jgi:PadR family transcriptional regulator, regulatory protein PadR
MARARGPSPQTIAILQALLAEPETWRYGYELGQEVGVKAGSLYPILIRLAERGLLEASWEVLADEPAGRPPRHLYRLTGDGRELARQCVPATAPVRAPGRLRSAT